MSCATHVGDYGLNAYVLKPTSAHVSQKTDLVVLLNTWRGSLETDIHMCALLSVYLLLCKPCQPPRPLGAMTMQSDGSEVSKLRSQQAPAGERFTD